MQPPSADRRYVPSIATAVGRWAKFGPYYAMFPVGFAFKAIHTYTDRGQLVLDPFTGRGTSIFAAAALGRRGFGVEINPVGWIYGQTKLRPAPIANVLARLEAIAKLARDESPPELPQYFRWAFAPSVLRFLTTARRELRWKTRSVDQTLMAMILVYLHGKPEAALSNQMRQTKSMSPEYSVAWWKERDLRPPVHDVVAFLRQRIEWRYAYGVPDLVASTILHGDSTKVLPTRVRLRDPRWSLLLTSPPYSGITNYWYDQWLRLWMLGEPAMPRNGDERTGRFTSRERYRALLEGVFMSAAENAAKGAVIYVRTDARERSATVTEEVLRAAFPRKRVRRYRRPVSGRTQTDLFGTAKSRPGELDYVLH